MSSNICLFGWRMLLQRHVNQLRHLRYAGRPLASIGPLADGQGPRKQRQPDDRVMPNPEPAGALAGNDTGRSTPAAIWCGAARPTPQTPFARQMVLRSDPPAHDCDFSPTTFRMIWGVPALTALQARSPTAEARDTAGRAGKVRAGRYSGWDRSPATFAQGPFNADALT